MGVCVAGLDFGAMPRRHERDVHDIMRQISRDLRAASDESLNYEGTSFQRRAQVLRDMSGLCRKGLLRMAIAALEHGVNRRLFARMRQSDAVQDILAMSRTCSVEEREQLALLIMNELGLQDPDPVDQERIEARLTPRVTSEDLLVPANEGHSPSPRRSRVRASAEVSLGEGGGREPGQHESVLEDDLSRNSSRDGSEHVAVRDAGTKRPRTPPRGTGVPRPLPPPPAAPVVKRPRHAFSWQVPWADLVKTSTEFKKDEVWITCRACLKWFRKPSAFKQHLLMKIGVGDHPPSPTTSRWNFNEMWDGEFEEYAKEVNPQRVAAKSSPPVRTPPVSRVNPDLAARFAELEAMGVPAPPLSRHPEPPRSNNQLLRMLIGFCLKCWRKRSQGLSFILHLRMLGCLLLTISRSDL